MKKNYFQPTLYTIVFLLSLTFNLNGQQLGYTNAYPNLTFDTPLEIVPSNDGSNRLFISEKPGYIYQIQEATGIKSLVADLSGVVTSGRDGTEIGLLGMALHPDFRNNKLFYIYYIDGNPPYKVNLAQLTLYEGNPSATVNSRRVVFTATKPTTHHTHNGGHIEFGPDGYLYMGVGDGGDSTGSGNQRAQDLSHIFGSILRIGINTNGTFYIPSSNPFASSGDADTRKIWIFGLRNPWKFSFHGSNLWIGDVGAGQQDEINRVSPSYSGSNYGWGRWEGTYQDPSVTLSGGTLRPPYFSKSATSLTGGYVYNGPLTNPEIRGKYVFADYISGDIWAINANAGPDSTNPSVATNTENLSQAKLFTTSPDDAAIVSFGRNESGTQLYFLRYGQNYDTDPNSPNAYNFEDDSGAIFKITGEQSNQPVAVNGIGNFDQCDIDLNGRVNVMEEVNGTLWLGGNFTDAAGVAVSKIVAFNKNTGFTASYYVSGEVEDIHATANGDIWIGGNFSSINSIPTRNLAQLSNGLIINHNSTGVVYEIDSSPSGTVYFVGASTSVSGVSISKFARYNGSYWDNMNTFPNNELRAIEVASNGNIFIGGNFTAIGNVGANRLARFDGSRWNPFPGSSSLFIKEIEEFNGYLYVGGQNYVGRYLLANGTHHELSNNVAGGEVRALTWDGTYLYLGGTFGTVSNNGSTNLIMNGLARWTPSTNTFQALGPGTNVGTDYPVNDLAYSDGRLCIGGEFTDIGSYFALWSTGTIVCPSNSGPTCPDDIANENTSMPLNNRLSSGNIAINGTSTQANGSSCAMELSSPSGQPWARYVIPINLAAEGIQAGDRLNISIDGRSGSGSTKFQIARNNTPNTSLMTRSFNGSWSTQSGEITVPSGVSTLDIWLFSNFGNYGSGNSYFDNLNVSVVGGTTTDCTDDIANENTTMPLNNRTTAGTITVRESVSQTNGSPCAMELSSPAGQPWARYIIPINLAAEGIRAGDRLNISIDGRSGSGSTKFQIARNNTPNTSLMTRSFNGSWSRQGGEITVPSGVSTLDIWLFSNFGNYGSSSSYFDNLNVSVVGGTTPPDCGDDIANENTAMPLTQRNAAGSITVRGNNNGSTCEMELSSPAGQPWARYLIPINLAAQGIRAGDRLNISIDGKNGSGNARIELNRNNTPNDNLLFNTFGSSWSTHSRTIIVPSGVTTLDIWLFPNYGRSNSSGTAFFRNFRVSKVSGTSLKATLEPLIISENEIMEIIKVFPNPGTDEVTVTLPPETDYTSYNLLNLNGVLVKKGAIEKDQNVLPITINGLENGLYLLNLTNNRGESKYVKIIKE